MRLSPWSLWPASGAYMRLIVILFALIYRSAMGIMSQNATLFFGGDATNKLPAFVDSYGYFDSSVTNRRPSLRISSSVAAAVLSTAGGILQRHILAVEPERLNIDRFDAEYFRTNDFLGCISDFDKYAAASNRTVELCRITGDYLEYAFDMFRSAVNIGNPNGYTWGGYRDGDYLRNPCGWGSSVLDNYIIALNAPSALEAAESEGNPELLEYNPEFPVYDWREGSAWQWRTPGQWAYTWPMLCYCNADGFIISTNTSFRPPETILDTYIIPLSNWWTGENFLRTNPPVMRSVEISRLLASRYVDRPASNYNVNITSNLINTSRMSHAKAGAIQYAVAMMDRLYGQSSGFRTWQGKEQYASRGVDYGGGISVDEGKWQFTAKERIPGAFVGTMSINQSLPWGDPHPVWILEDTTNFCGGDFEMNAPFYSCSGIHHGYGGIVSASQGLVVPFEALQSLILGIGPPGTYEISLELVAPDTVTISAWGLSRTCSANLNNLYVGFSVSGAESTFVVYPGNVISNADPYVHCSVGVGGDGLWLSGKYLWSMIDADVYSFDRMEVYGEYTSAGGLDLSGRPEQASMFDYGLSVYTNYVEYTRIRKLRDGINKGAKSIHNVSNMVLNAADNLKAQARSQISQLIGGDIEDLRSLLVVDNREIMNLRGQIDGAIASLPARSSLYMSSFTCSCDYPEGPYTVTYRIDSEGSAIPVTHTLVMTPGTVLSVGSISADFVPTSSKEGSTPPASVYATQYFPTRYRFSLDTINLPEN